MNLPGYRKHSLSEVYTCSLSIKAIELLSEMGIKLDKYLKAIARQGFIIDKYYPDVMETYNNLIAKVPDNYDLKVYPNCFETKMILLSVSPTGQSIEHKCAYLG